MLQSGPFPIAARFVAGVGAVTLVMFLADAPAAAPRQPTTAPCPAAASETAVVTAVSDGLEFTLSDRRVARLAGLEPPRPTAHAPARARDASAAIRARVEGVIVGLAPMGGADRWGTTPVLMFVGEENLSKALLSRGDVRFWPEAAARACRDMLLEAEASARLARRDVWADPALQVLVADEALTEASISKTAADGMIVVEGVVASVGETASRLYINLGRARGGFAISVAKRDTTLMDSDAVREARTVGKRLRIRGLADRQAGLRIDLSDASAIELLPSSPGGAQAPGR